MKLCIENKARGCLYRLELTSSVRKASRCRKMDLSPDLENRGEVNPSVDLFRQVDPSVDLGPGWEFSRPARVSVFEFPIQILNSGLIFTETSEGHIFFIRSPIYANLDSISSRISRRTQWRNPFPLISSF